LFIYASTCGDKPTAQGYSFTCEHMNNLMHHFILNASFITNRRLRVQSRITSQTMAK
jgi:hypothetical protein